MTDTPLSVADVLEHAADLIEPEGAWVRGRLAGNTLGERVEPEDHDATCWCLMGATDRAAFDLGLSSRLARAARDRFRFSMGDISLVIPAWNDSKDRTQPEVVAALRRAATLARAEVQA